MSDRQIDDRIEAFVRELEGLVRAHAIESVRAALAGKPSTPIRSGTLSARPAKATRSKARTGSKPAAPATPKRTATPTVLGGLDAKAIAYVKAHPGKRLEEIAKALGVPSPGLKPRFANLVEKKALRKTGATRGTKYFAA